MFMSIHQIELIADKRHDVCENNKYVQKYL